MKPPAGRLRVGDVVTTRDGQRGRIVEERLIASNGAWSYVVTLDGGGNVERDDFDLRRVAEG